MSVADNFNPNWLYSTAAQSAAALVAIMGGFLVSRLIALSVDKDSLRRRTEEAKNRLGSSEDHLRAVSDEVRSVSRKRFWDLNLEECVVYEGVLPADAEIRSSRGSTDEEVEKWRREMSSEVIAAIAGSLSVLHQGEWTISLEDAVKRGFNPDKYAFNTGTLAFRHAMKKRRREGQLPGWELPSYIGSITLPNRDWERSEQTERINRRSELAAETGARRAEVDLLESELRNVGKPQGVVFGIIALSIFSVIGIVFPLVLMSLRPVPDAFAERLATVIAFVVGLILLMAFIFVELRTIRRSRDHGTE
ncbi:MAG: hypothetical protein WA359_08920 [Acidimicrobiales bacterium]